MQSMPICQNKGLLLVKTDQFKEACLPYPQKIIFAVNQHLPVVANRKNEALLKVIKVKFILSA